MIILHIIGGLGNQLSQLAFSMILAKKYKEKLYIDTTAYKTYKRRKLAVTELCINQHIELAEKAQVSGLHKMWLNISRNVYHLQQKIIRCFRPIIGEKIYTSYAKRGHYYSFDSVYYGMPETKCRVKDVYGYFLSERCFRDHQEMIKAAFQPIEAMPQNAATLMEWMTSGNSVGVSIRLQDDYMLDPDMNVCKKEYYIKAIEYIQQRVESPEFYIFADDIDKAKALNLPCKAQYVFGFTEVQSLHLLSSCKHFVISNSSFAWWGAYLSDNQEKCIVVPNRWMNNRKDYSDKYYEGMHKINV